MSLPATSQPRADLGPQGPSARGTWALFACVLAIVLAADQALKAWARATLSPDFQPVLIPRLLGLELVENSGAAFGILAGHVWAFVVCAIVIVGACLAAQALVKPRSRALTCALALVCAGGVGNVIDRVAQGYVTDMLRFLFVDFPVFNLADVAIVCGFALLVVVMLRRGRS